MGVKVPSVVKITVVDWVAVCEEILVIFRVGPLSAVGKVEFADIDGIEAVDVFAVIFVDLLDSEYDLVWNDEALEIFEESSGIVVSSLGTVGEVESGFTGVDDGE